jgi:glycine cleavage system H protein
MSGDTAEVGITHFAQEQLGDVVYVELPEVGRQLSAGDAFGSIESVKAVSELFSPASGEVVAVNAAVKEHPETVNSSPHETWMIRLRLQASHQGTPLLDSTQYEALVR